MGAYSGSRFGQDGPARIATSAEMLLEATEMPPVPTYQPLVPFFPPSLINGDGSGSSSSAALAGIFGSDGSAAEWKEYPDRLDLYAYQGDDIQIPLYFTNPADPDLDMSDEAGYTWWSQIRTRHFYDARLVTEFTISSEFIPAGPVEDPTPAFTKVTLFLPRMLNRYRGLFQWELASKSAYEGPDDFPQPVSVADEDWPMTDQIKTWLFGYVYVVPRLTVTDWLPLPPNSIYSGTAVTVYPGGFVVGPNGRVP